MSSGKKNNHEQTTPQATEDLENSHLSEDDLEAVAGGRKQNLDLPIKIVPPGDLEFGPGHIVVTKPIRTKM